MKKLWIALLLLPLAACGISDVRIARPPSFFDVGDSISIQYLTTARVDLCGQVLAQHDAHATIDDAPVKSVDCTHPAQPDFDNDGCTNAMVGGVVKRIQAYHYTVIAFNSGMHDFQKGIVTWHRSDGTTFSCGQINLATYRANLEILAKAFQQHSDFVIWVDTTDVPWANPEGDPVGEQAVYNPVGDDVAREHGFYILHFQLDDAADVRPNDIHLTGTGEKAAGKQLADCVLAALAGQETTNCHH